MLEVDTGRSALTCSVVYCGPASAGKAENLARLEERAPETRARPGAGADPEDALSLDLGVLGGVATRLELRVAPAGVERAGRRERVLAEADAVVFVADSRRARLVDDARALEELAATLRRAGRSLDDLTLVFQWNRRDAADALPVAELARVLNQRGVPAVEAVAANGRGVLDTVKVVTRLLLQRARGGGGAEPSAGPEPAAEVEAAEAEADRPKTRRGVPPRRFLAPSRTPAVPVELALPRRTDEYPATPLEGVPLAPDSEDEVPVVVSECELAFEGPPPPAPPAPPAAVEAPGDAAAEAPGGAAAAAVAPSGGEARAEGGSFWASSSGSAEAGAPLVAPGALPEPPEPSPPRRDPLVGERCGNCVVRRKLGEGGMGSVYLAAHESLGKQVVVKVLRPEFAAVPRRVERFFLEARAAARLDHPNIVSVLDVGTNARGVHFMVMQYVEGQNLFERVRDRGHHAPAEAVGIALSVAQALSALHAVGVIHRDVKPENVVITPEGEVKLIDFGLAKDLNADRNLTRVGAMVGTPNYMAPETGRVSEIDGRVDIYSLGLTLYFLLTARPPFAGSELADVVMGRARLSAPEAYNPGLDGRHRLVLARSLAWDRRRRYQTADAFVEELDALLRGRPVAPGEPPFTLLAAAAAASAAVPPTLAPLDAEASLADDRALDESDRRRLDAEVQRASADPANHLGRYVLLRQQEATRGSVVYRAWDGEERRLVAVHRVRDALSLTRAAERALKALARLDDPRVLALVDRGIERGRPFLVTQPLPGETLRSLLEEGPLDPAAAVRVVRDAAHGLEHARDAVGLLHGALRPTSVVVGPDGSGAIADLGLVALRRGGDRRGPRGAAYQAPERASGDGGPTVPGDVYALGAILYHALVGHAPVRAPGGGLPAPSVRRPGLPRALDVVVLGCLADDPRRRYATPGDVARDLGRFLRGELPFVARSSGSAAPAAAVDQALVPRDQVVYLALALGVALAFLLWAIGLLMV